MNKKYDDIKIPNNIDSIIEDGAKKASILKRKKSRKRGMSIAAALAVFMIVGVTSKPALAGDIPVLSDLYIALGFTEDYLPVTKYVGKSVEGDGIKVTVDNIAATNQIIKMTVKIESEAGIFELPSDYGVHVTAEVNGMSVGSGGGSYNVDKNTQVRVLDLMTMDGFPSNGTIKLNISSEEYDIDESLEFKVDFTDSMKDNYKKNVIMEKSCDGNNVYSLEATGIGTMLEVETYKGDTDSVILKIDDRVYYWTGPSIGDEEKSYMFFDEVLKEDVEKAKDISVIIRKDVVVQGVGIVSWPEQTEQEKKAQEEKLKEANIKYEEEQRIYNEAYSKLQKENKDNISYVTEIQSKTGEIVYLSGVERNENKITVAIDGQNKSDALSVAINMYLDYEDDSLYEGRMILRETNTGYVLEYDKVKDENVVLRAGNILLGDSVVTEEVKLILK